MAQTKTLEKTPRSLPVIDAKARRPVPCLTCALCCTYVAVEISEPATVRAATEILWHLYHENVSVYFDGEDWLVQFESRCRHLRDDNKCAIYDKRPHVCRDYSEVSCEINSEEEGMSFFTPDAFLEYLKGRSTRIYRAVLKDYVPDEPHLGPYRAQAKKAMSPFPARQLSLRALGVKKRPAKARKAPAKR
jgi:Fe-S-cluster containining protein